MLQVVAVVCHHPLGGRPELGVVLHDDNLGARACRLPDPVIVAVDIDAQQIDFTPAGGGDQLRNILLGDEAVQQRSRAVRCAARPAIRPACAAGAP